MADKNMERVRLLQSMAQTGLEYARDPYDRDRYRKILTVASEMAAD